MKERIAIYPGTFDPITFGHLDVIEVVSGIFDKVIISVAKNINKQCLFTLDERVMFIKEMLKEKNLTNVEVRDINIMTADFVFNVNAIAIVRGLRLLTDYEAELDMSFNNYLLSNGTPTVFIAPKQEHLHIRASTIRELIKFGKFELRGYIPDVVTNYVVQKALGEGNIRFSKD